MKRVAPPSGAAAPERADGLDLRALADEVVVRYAREFPDEDERYEPEVWRAWCRHDTQYLLEWAILDVKNLASLGGQVTWLARVLNARGFPLDRLKRTLELTGEVAAEAGREDVALRLRTVASAPWASAASSR